MCFGVFYLGEKRHKEEGDDWVISTQETLKEESLGLFTLGIG
jgi:hypothetical protein